MFTNHTSAAHCTNNYCPTKLRKVLSRRVVFNVCGETCMFSVCTHLYRLMCKPVLFQAAHPDEQLLRI